MSKKTILIIEDSPYLAESLVDMLHIKNHESVVAMNGREGIQKAIDLHPDLILLDIRLPDIDGYEVYHSIRNDGWGKKAHIVILTASESTENIMKNIDLPEEKILFKPEWSAPDLMSKIDSLLEN